MCALNPLFEHPAAITGRINFKRADLAEFVGFAGDWSSVVQLVPTPQPPFPRAEGDVLPSCCCLPAGDALQHHPARYLWKNSFVGQGKASVGTNDTG